MNFEESIKKGTLFSFVPAKLEIEGKPEFDIFPLNVLFASFTVKDGIRIMGSAIYEPDLESLKKQGNEHSMKYYNAYGDNCWLLISYNKKEKRYHGDKFVNGNWSGGADGVEWNMFFSHFTALGLVNDERYQFEKLT